MSRETWVIIDGEFVCKSREGVITDEYAKLSVAKGFSWGKYGSDALGEGVKGVLNPADGKRYDSKSEFHKAVRAKGCSIVGNDWNDKQFKRPDPRGDFNVRPQMRDAVERAFSRGH